MINGNKVVQLSSVHPSNDTRIFYKICTSLYNAGYSVDLIIQHDKCEIKEGINIIALPIAKKKSDRLFKIIPKLIRLCFQYPKETIFHFHDPELIPVGLLLKLRKYKVIYDVHEDVPKDLLTKEWIPKRLRKGLSKVVESLEKYSSECFDGIITVVDTISERFSNYNHNVIQIRNYPILKENSPENGIKKSISKKYIIYIGDLTTRRGIPKLVDAIDLVEDRNVELWLGGNFSEKDLFETVKEKKGWNRTKHLGWVKQEEINEILKDAICGLLTLEVIPTHDESLNVKMFEYMMAEIAVVSTKLSVPSLVIEESKCGIILNEHTPKKIANAVNYLTKNIEEAKRMGKNGKKAVLLKYTWDIEQKKLLAFYLSILG